MEARFGFDMEYVGGLPVHSRDKQRLTWRITESLVDGDSNNLFGLWKNHPH